MAEPSQPTDPARRRLLSRGGAALVAGTLLGRLMPAGAVGPSAGGQGFEGLGYTSLHDDGTSPYDGAHQPPAEMGPEALDHHTLPPPAKSGDRDLEIDVVERRLRVGAGFDFQAWTYGGTVPGPIIRAREGSRIRVRLRNRTGRPHNLHFHGSHSPAMDGWEPIPPGGEFTYELEAGPVGVHPYHCHVPPLARHISRGLYGMLIVDPPAGRPPAQEIALVLSGFSDGTTPNRVMAWNGVAGFYHRFPIKVPAGEPVRAYVVNMTEYEPVGSFHLHARTFEVFPAGMGDDPAFSSDTITLGQGERAMLEFTLPTAGRYMFHPHQHHLAERGAMGWLAAV